MTVHDLKTGATKSGDIAEEFATARKYPPARGS
jgi:hypothetical protein